MRWMAPHTEHEPVYGLIVCILSVDETQWVAFLDLQTGEKGISSLDHFSEISIHITLHDAKRDSDTNLRGFIYHEW